MRTQCSQINIFKRRKRLIGLQAMCQFDSVHPGGSRGKSLSLSFLSWDAARLPWFMVSFFIFKVSSVAIFKCLSLIFLSLSLSLTLVLLSPSYKLSNPVCQKPSYWIPLNTLPTRKPVLSTSFCFSTHDKYIISMLKPKTLKSFLTSLFHVLQPMQMFALPVCSYKHLYTNVHSSFIPSCQTWKYSRHPSTGERCTHPANGILLVSDKKIWAIKT